ncbi:hypothetical protein [Candidatus Nitrosotenuis cloacae]|jgi:hypothetical protein|uniref:hypothetical protein n=1 Tax=Candidatus Nitrosotenuis cloacae TaxID=1603555 RepID=UPI00228014C4|nr:hypothetical protein [Candidatus Nitrosotenuis cloacae]
MKCSEKRVILEQLEQELKSHQKKYQYHKRISEGYSELIQKTQQKLAEWEGNAF